MPAGEYSYVYCVDVEVFMSVIYDPETGNYQVDTYSIMSDKIKSMILYKLSPDSNITLEAGKNLVCNFSPEEFKTYMDNAYYVSYDANGGEGKMYNSGHARGESHALSENEFTRQGYVWNGWKLENGKIVYKNDKVSDLSEKGKVISAQAQWTPIAYTIKYDGNGFTSREMPDSSFTYDKEEELSQNKFEKIGYTFAGWSTAKDGEVLYFDKENVCNLTDQAGGIVTLYAVWEANTYTVTYDANGGEGTPVISTHTYDTPSSLRPNGFTRGAEYAFLGWSDKKDDIKPTYLDKEEVSNLATGGNETLYAIWVKKYAAFEFSSATGRNDIWLNANCSHADYVNPKMDLNALIENGYTQLRIKVGYYGNEGGSIWPSPEGNDARVEIYSCGKWLAGEQYDIVTTYSGDWLWKEFTFYTNLTDHVNTDLSFDVKYSTVKYEGADGDGWWVGSGMVWVTAVKA